MVHQIHSKKTPDLDAVYTFDLKIAQARGLVSYLTGRCAVIQNDTTPSEALVRVVEISQKEVWDIDFIRYNTNARVTDVTRSSSSIGTEKTLCNEVWTQHGETRCVTTGTNQIS